MKLYQMADHVRFERMTTDELRATFLLDELAQPGEIRLAYIDAERTVAGFACPAEEPLTLGTYPELRSEFFLERREIGILNVGGAGAITVDGQRFDSAKLDVVYAGRGSRSVVFESADPANPACFYLLSYPAHAVHPVAKTTFADLEPVRLGAIETCNKRSIYKAIHKDGIQSCQLVMGFTLLEPGSNWNTMPPHTHMRRSEIYLYFDLAPEHRVIHLMGPPNATRNLVVANREIVMSPGWSIHAGVGTSNYVFCWGMGGENQDYSDMDPAPIATLR